jgi:hypothetical protein
MTNNIEIITIASFDRELKKLAKKYKPLKNDLAELSEKIILKNNQRIKHVETVHRLYISLKLLPKIRNRFQST